MDQAIYGNHSGAGPGPIRPLAVSRQQEAGHGHAQHLGTNSLDVAQRADQGTTEQIARPKLMRTAGPQLIVNPSYKVASRHVPHEHEERISRPVQPSVAQVMPWQ